MKNIGSFLMLIGVAAIVLDFMDRVPRLLFWIYLWGDEAAWVIKIILIAAGAALFFLGKKKEDEAKTEDNDTADKSE